MVFIGRFGRASKTPADPEAPVPDLATDTAKTDQELAVPTNSRGPLFGVFIGGLAYAGLGLFGLLALPAILLENWLPDGTTSEHGRLLGTAAQLVLVTLGGGIAIIGVGLSMLRHTQELKAADRDRQRLDDDRVKEARRQQEASDQRDIEAERELRSRFVTSVELLSAVAPIKRTAALYALAALSDDWDSRGRRDEVQVCIDVICGYLRSPLAEGVTETPAEEIAIRETAFKLIEAHLKKNATHWWGDLIVDLTRAHIDYPVYLQGVHLGGPGRLWFVRTTVSARGRVMLRNASVTGDAAVSFFEAKIDGAVSLFGTTLSEGRLSFGNATLSGEARIQIFRMNVDAGALVSFQGVAVDTRAYVSSTDMRLGNGAVLSFDGMQARDKTRVFNSSLEVKDGSKVTFEGAKLHDEAIVDLQSVSFEAGGTLSLKRAILAGDARLTLPGVTVTRVRDVALTGAAENPDGPVTLPDGRTVFLKSEAGVAGDKADDDLDDASSE